MIKGCSSSLQCMDMGEDMGVPDDFSEQDLTSGMWWRHLVAVCLYLWYFETKYYYDSDKVPIIYYAYTIL